MLVDRRLRESQLTSLENGRLSERASIIVEAGRQKQRWLERERLRTRRKQMKKKRSLDRKTNNQLTYKPTSMDSYSTLYLLSTWTTRYNSTAKRREREREHLLNSNKTKTCNREP